MKKRQSGFGAIAAVVVLVICAVLAAAVVSLSSTQQMTSAQDIQSARAWQAARAGNEWGLYQALQNSGSCVAAKTLSVGNGFNVTVSCTQYPSSSPFQYDEGGAKITVYKIEAVSCNAASCPAAAATAASPGYVERRRVVLATN